MKRIAFILAVTFPLFGLAAEPPAEAVDVMVVGGGAAGICAAVQSGRAGARTVLVEAGHQVGGNMTTGGVNWPGLFHAWGRQVIDGIGWSLVTNCVALDGGVLPDFTKPTGPAHWNHQVRINIPLFVALSEEALRGAGVTVLYHAAPAGIVPVPDGWTVEVESLGEIRRFACRELVDCTGNGAVAARLGLARERGNETQPGTFNYRIERGGSAAIPPPDVLRRLYAAALAEGRLTPYDIRGGVEGVLAFLRTGEGLENYVTNADNSTAFARTETNLRGRASMLRTFRFLRSLPGIGPIHLVSMAPEVGVRETYRVVCERTVTADDYISGRVWPDAICYAFYPIDLHGNDTGVHPRPLREGIVATVPLRALVPAGSTNLLVAGRCLGSDRAANAALRVQATCMATGQAAGAAAALAARLHVTPAAVPPEELRGLLRRFGALVP